MNNNPDNSLNNILFFPGANELINGSFLLIIILFFIFLPVVFLYSFLIRKLVADIQARIGPNRSGGRGFWQPMVDSVKLLQKNIHHKRLVKKDYIFMVYAAVLFSAICLVSLASGINLLNTELNVLFLFFLVVFLDLILLFFSLNGEEIREWFGGFRAAAQVVSACFPALFSILNAGMYAGGFGWHSFLVTQSAHPLTWIALSGPFLFVSFFVFFLSGMIIVKMPPFDAPFSSPELQGGVLVQSFGWQKLLFSCCRRLLVFLWAFITINLFLGGWHLPDVLLIKLKSANHVMLRQLLECTMLTGKSFVLVVSAECVSRLIPKFRINQTTEFSWKILSPIGLMAFLLALVARLLGV